MTVGELIHKLGQLDNQLDAVAITSINGEELELDIDDVELDDDQLKVVLKLNV